MLSKWQYLVLSYVFNIAIGAGITSEIGAPLGVMPDCDMGTGDVPTCKLTFGVYQHIGPGSTFTTRNYLGGLPGPIIRVRAAGTDINLPHLPNSTNFHTHGLHVSGNSPGDNVFVTIAPQESRTFAFQLPENHMGGTFFYHPHHHGSASIQLGGGACGMIIVEDEEGALPPMIEAMEDVPLLLQYIEINRVKAIQTLFNDNLLQTTGGGAPVFLTNGQTAPIKVLRSGAWTRLRLLYTSMSHIMTLDRRSGTGSATCEWQLIAKDGIYLNTAPRVINKVYLPEGGRADVVVRCFGEGSVDLVAAVQSRLNYTALTLVVSEEDQAEPDDVVSETDDNNDVTDIFATIPQFSVTRPCYLVDTRHTTPTTLEDLTLGTGVPNTKLNGIFFSSPEESLNPTNPFYTGTLGEITLIQGTYVHVLHIHVHPFQLSAMSPVVDSDFFQEGDWHDTLNTFISQHAGDTQMKIRFWVDKFAGHAVVHCHMLNDEDAGMMNTYLVDGEEGASVDEVARLTDPTCYSDLTSRGYVYLDDSED